MRIVQDAYAIHGYTHAVIFEKQFTKGNLSGTKVRDRVRHVDADSCQKWIDGVMKNVQMGKVDFILTSTEIVQIRK